MRNFSSKTRANSRRSFNQKTVTKVLVLIVGAALALLFFRSILGGAVALVTTPIYEIRNWFVESSATIPSYFRDRDALIDEITSLENRISTLTNRDATLAKVLSENERLRALLGGEEEDRIAAGVVARPPYVPYDALLIDRGRRHGISEGAVVYHAGDRAIGFVAKVYESSALVSLFTSPGVESTVYILGPDIYTKAYGEGGGVLRVSVPQGIDLSEGDIVVLPSLAAGLLGTISIVESTPTQPEQNAFVTLGTSIQSLQFVSVSRYVPEDVTFEEAQKIIEDTHASFLEVDVPDEIIVDTATSTAGATTDAATLTPTPESVELESDDVTDER